MLESDPRHDRGVISANPWHVTAVELYLACGEMHEADRLLERISSDLADRDDPVLTVALGRLRAMRLAHSGKDDAATEAFEQALADAEGCPAPLEVALLQLELGAHLRRAGQRRAAAEQLEAAAGAFRSAGAGPHLERAERELAACGLTPTKRAAPSRELTPQERTVAVLASRGKRNKEIAAELVVSPKTVEYHLGNVYRKLGVSNRAQLVAAMGEDPAPV